MGHKADHLAWNVRSLRMTGAKQEVFDQLKSYRVDIAAVQDVQKKWRPVMTIVSTTAGTEISTRTTATEYPEFKSR